MEEERKKSDSPNRFGQLLKDWLRFSKTHGLDRLVISKNPVLRVIWLLSLIASIVVCSLLISEIVSNYQRYEVKTRIREVYTQKIPFPKILACNFNPMMGPNANEYIKEYFRKKFNISVSKYADLLETIDDLAAELKYSFYATNDPLFNDTLRKSLGYKFMYSCTVNENLCNPEDILESYDPYYGNCYLVNSRKYQNGSDRDIYQAYFNDFGLRLIMFSGLPEAEANNLFDITPSQKGISLRFEDTYYDGIMLNEVGISPGYHAQIVLTRIETKNMPHPYSKCVPADLVNTHAAKYMKQMGITYNRKTCLYICQQIRIIREVGCNHMQYPIIPSFPLCRTLEEYLNAEKVDFDLAMCTDLCPIECDLIHYEVSVSNTIWPTYNSYVWAKPTILKDFLGTQNVTYEAARESFASVSIIFRDIKYTEIEETESMTLVDLIAAIGGMMGLFLGFSLMVLVELVELVLEFFFVLLNPASKKVKVGT